MERIISLEKQDQQSSGFLSQMMQQDKLKHFTSSLMLVTTSGYYLHFTDVRDQTIPNYSMGFSFSLGVAKELYDRKQPGGDASWGDILADVTGTICGGILLHNLPR